MSARFILFVVFKCLVLCVSNTVSQIDKECLTPRQIKGDCRLIQDCPIIANVLQTNRLNDEIKNHLQSYICGYSSNYKPKVCCEKDASPCKTPEQTAGICVPINRCPAFLRLFETKPFLSKDIVDYLQKSECSSEPNNQARLCCPFIDKPDKQILTKEPLQILTRLPKPGECGIQEEKSKIIGGIKTELSEFPWMAILEYGSKIKPSLACGGTLISSKFVLTAGHCVTGPTVDRYGGVQRIRLGEYNIRNETDCIALYDPPDCTLPIVRIDVENMRAHENFVIRSKERAHDIAIIKMKQAAEYTDFVRPICLPTPDIPLPNKFDIAGWGKTELSDQSADKLKLTIPLFDKTSCTNLYIKLAGGLKLTKGQICAGGVPGKDSCTGDSGGPLMAGISGRTDEIWYQFGVISFGPTPCGKPHPAVYTLVTEYLPWINEQINTL